MLEMHLLVTRNLL
ncbi:uncharacterized protein FFM5_15345 [Fusarium fujikuroi]|nr:uncharacterized protein FFM5_15345 [Fusarium fujikuroi]